ncbi:MAG: HDOD domain-containing protein [Gammaproteobacteria bacterium]|nr:HDOD domain-containing protein [Gammaproteobacteria bacterium]
MSTKNSTPVSENDGGAIEFLLRRMQRRRDFPVLSETIRTLNRLSASNEKSVEHLAAVIVRDYALTNKILKVVNSAYYGGFAGKVGTISRAIVVLGIEPIRALAASLILFEHLSDHRNAARVKALIGRSVFAALLARELSQGVGVAHGEEAFLAAMFQNLGELLVAYYLPDEDAAILSGKLESGVSGREAEYRVLGVDLEHLGIAIGSHWSFPSAITHAMKKLPSGKVGKPVSAEDRLRHLARLSCEITDCMAQGLPVDGPATSEVLARFADSTVVDVHALADSLRDTRSEYRLLAAGLAEQDSAPEDVRVLAGTRPSPGDSAGADNGELEGVALKRDEAGELLTAEPEPILLEGLQEVTAMLAEGDAIHEIAQAILETLYRALSLRRVALCLRDAGRRQFAGRMGFGDDVDSYLGALRFDEAYERDVFHIALKQKTDVHIGDLAVAASGHGIPAWYHRLAAHGSMLFLPLTVQERAVGFLLAEHAATNALALSPPVLRLVRALRNQLALGLQLRRSS